jgi:hypothetical protein
MQTELARAELLKHLRPLVRKTWLLRLTGMMKPVTEICNMCDQALDALDAVKAIGQLNAAGIDVIEMENLE